MKSLGRTVVTFTVIVITVTVFLYYAGDGFLDALEAKTYDFRFRALGANKIPTGKIAVIEIDDKSLAEIGRFPWPRKEYVGLINAASAGGAKAVLFDIIFPEAESPKADSEFAEAIKRSGIVTLPVVFEFSPNGRITGVLESIPVLRDASGRAAHINISPDDDGVIRWSRVLINHKGAYYPSLGLAAAMSALGEGFQPGEYGVYIGGEKIPTDREFRFVINYTGPSALFDRYSFSDVARGRVSPMSLKDKVLLVGPTALGIYDMRVTPYSNNSSGVEVNANIAESIVRGDFIKRGGAETLADVFLIVFLAVSVSTIASRLRVLSAFPFVLFVMSAYVFFAFLMYQRGVWLSIIYPCLSGILCYGGASYFRFVLLDRKANQIRAMFSSYVSKKIVDRLVKDPSLAKVGGESKVVTIMFADIINYTGYSEKRSPSEVVKILNEYLAEMTGVIMEHDGTLDKFLGDGILAYWGAPVPQPDHAELAARCALKMLDRLRRLHEKWKAEGEEPLSCGIGLNTGEVIVGNIGAEGKKMEHTVIGDNVNLTYRIQNEGRTLNLPVITKSVNDLVKGIAVTEYIGSVSVRGKEKPVEIYALKGLRP